ncbi:MAG TPA: hypothetical protein VM073_01505 [Usitatibacter sp.]|nr:hypothetical protein [Usitatibacter sp.]
MKAIAGVAACLLAGTAHAQHAGKGHGHDNETASAARGGGQLRAITPEEARELVAGMAPFVNQSDAGLISRTLPSGAVAVDLEGRFQSVALARIAVDGSTVVRCVGGKDEAMQFLTMHALHDPHVAAKRRPATRVVLEEK